MVTAATAVTAARSGTLASLSSSSKLVSVQRSRNFCLPAAFAAIASKRNVPECIFRSKLTPHSDHPDPLFRAY